MVVDAGGSGAQKKGYLAQHQLFEQIPALARDIMTPEYCALGEGLLQSVNAWLGPTGTVSAPLAPSMSCTDPRPGGHG